MSTRHPRQSPNLVLRYLSQAIAGTPIRPVPDLPHDDSIEFAGSVLTPSIHPGLKPGKGLFADYTYDDPTGYDEHIAHPVITEGSKVVLLRPRGRKCHSGCGRPGVVHVPDDDRHWCTECKPRGTFGVIDGGAA